MKILLILLFLIPTYCFADEFVVDGGIGAFSTEGRSLSEVKFAKLGVQEDLWYSLKQRFSGGGWLDSRGAGEKNSVFGSYQLGFQVDNEVFEASIFSGPSLISSPDTALGGPFQFNETVFIGVRDTVLNKGSTLGISYNHFSSAGLEMPNQGRDFLGLEMKVPF